MELLGRMMSAPICFSDVILHHLKTALGLSPVECETELVEVTGGQIQLFKHRTPNPTAAVIGAKGVVVHYEHPNVRLLDPHLAG